MLQVEIVYTDGKRVLRSFEDIIECYEWLRNEGDHVAEFNEVAATLPNGSKSHD